MDINKLYTDFWEKLGQYLSSDDIYSFALTCKGSWKACKRHSLKIRMSYPMSMPWRLTYEQRSVIKEMERRNTRFKLVQGSVGCGKTIVSISYAIRNYMSNPDAKIVMCGPPSLIQMWWTTLEKYFKIKPYVLHTTNTEYKSKSSWSNPPQEKFILISHILMGRHDNIDWFDNTRDILIIDEAHHRTAAPFTKFKEVMGLSATTTKKSGLARGINHILSSFNLIAEDCKNSTELNQGYTYYLNNSVISEALPPVEYHAYDTAVPQEILTLCRGKVAYTKKGEQDLTVIQDICKYLSHPEILSLRDNCTAGYIMVGRKKFNVEEGNSEKRSEAYFKCEMENPGMTGRERHNIFHKYATFDIMKFGRDYPKYVQTYHIIKWVFARGDKVVLFDNSVTYLPFLHKFLTEYGINSYIFSTHYDVTGRQRQLSKFKEDKAPAVLLTSIVMGGEGQNITEGNHVIFFTHTLDHTKYYQAIGRCWRYPQKKTVHVHLIFAGQFERKVYEHACNATDLRSYDWLELL